MKNILIMLAFVTVSCKAQIKPLSQLNSQNISTNVYFKDTENLLTPFIGIWKWENGNTIFTIKIEKIEDFSNPKYGFSQDILVLKYTYILNGTTVTNTIGNASNMTNYGTISNQTHDTVKISFYDEVKGKNCIATLKLLNTLETSGILTADDLSWELNDREYINTNQNPLPQGFSVPTSLTLTKVN